MKLVRTLLVGTFLPAAAASNATALIVAEEIENHDADYVYGVGETIYSNKEGCNDLGRCTAKPWRLAQQKKVEQASTNNSSHTTDAKPNANLSGLNPSDAGQVSAIMDSRPYASAPLVFYPNVSTYDVQGNGVIAPAGATGFDANWNPQFPPGLMSPTPTPTAPRSPAPPTESGNPSGSGDTATPSQHPMAQQGGFPSSKRKVSMVLAWADGALTPTAESFNGTVLYLCVPKYPAIADQDRVVQTMVGYTTSKEPWMANFQITSFKVWHQTIRGHTYKREQQYSNIRAWFDEKQPSKTVWWGQLGRDPKTIMYGWLQWNRIDGGTIVTYHELTCTNQEKNCAPITTIESNCVDMLNKPAQE